MKAFRLFFIFCTTFCFSQRTYQFDYELTFETDSLLERPISNRNLFQTTKNINIERFWVNSADNHYFTIIMKKDTVNYYIRFVDQSKLMANVLNRVEDFDGSDILNLQCDFVRPFSSENSSQRKWYSLLNMTDTILDGQSYGRYKLVPNNLKRAKRKKLGTEYFLVDKTVDAMPVLVFSGAYERFKQSNNISRGLLYQMYFINYEGKLLRRQTLVKKEKVDRKVFIDQDLL